MHWHFTTKGVIDNKFKYLTLLKNLCSTKIEIPDFCSLIFHLKKWPKYSVFIARSKFVSSNCLSWSVVYFKSCFIARARNYGASLRVLWASLQVETRIIPRNDWLDEAVTFDLSFFHLFSFKEVFLSYIAYLFSIYWIAYKYSSLLKWYLVCDKVFSFYFSGVTFFSDELSKKRIQRGD